MYRCELNGSQTFICHLGTLDMVSEGSSDGSCRFPHGVLVTGPSRRDDHLGGSEVDNMLVQMLQLCEGHVFIVR